MMFHFLKSKIFIKGRIPKKFKLFSVAFLLNRKACLCHNSTHTYVIGHYKASAELQPNLSHNVSDNFCTYVAIPTV